MGRDDHRTGRAAQYIYMPRQHVYAIGIENDRLRITVKQIAGILARRIVSWVTMDDHLAQGELYGMIRFGSCLEVTMPTADVDVLVKPGQKVTGGKTVLGRIKEK